MVLFRNLMNYIPEVHSLKKQVEETELESRDEEIENEDSELESEVWNSTMLMF